jgi:nicotinamidase-related amidase
MNSGLEAFSWLASRPAVVTIDLHRGHLDPAVATLPLPAQRAEKLTRHCIEVLTRFRAMGLPIIHVITRYRSAAEILSNPFWRFQADRPGSSRSAIARHNLEGGKGIELMPDIAGPGDLRVEMKKRYDCFLGTDLALTLKSLSADALLLMGVNTNSCVLATATGASVRDFAVFVIEDCVDALEGPELHQAALRIISAAFGWVVNSAEILELLEARQRQPTAGRTS